MNIELIEIPDDEGGGWSACIPAYGSQAYVGDGDSPGEALDDLFEHLKQFPLPKEDLTSNSE